ncbi:MAG TPA: hypothetical protein VHA82_04240 [Ramlibacter sp.]|uniref:hypothetical protein n=1 Tax=Ramlibacter sp. TaxID=1917967 RepID=UPI002CD32EA0|nr:hypothetical protein [Ramlibacter sp.]HVZ43000.1 hypothetical protein [Ramlibacter sp.]
MLPATVTVTSSTERQDVEQNAPAATRAIRVTAPGERRYTEGTWQFENFRGDFTLGPEGLSVTLKSGAPEMTMRLSRGKLPQLAERIESTDENLHEKLRVYKNRIWLEGILGDLEPESPIQYRYDPGNTRIW